MELKPLRPSNLIRVMPAKEVKEQCSFHLASSVWSTPPMTCPSCPRSPRSASTGSRSARRGWPTRPCSRCRGVGGHRRPSARGARRCQRPCRRRARVWRRRRPPRPGRSAGRRGARLAPDLVVGATCRDRDQARQAAADGADYAGFGPVFATASKTGLPAPLGTEAVRTAAGILPLVGIGGIDAVDGACRPSSRRRGRRGNRRDLATT